MTWRRWGFVAAVMALGPIVVLLGRLVSTAGATTHVQTPPAHDYLIIQPPARPHHGRKAATAVVQSRLTQSEGTAPEAQDGGAQTARKRTRIERLLATAGARALHMSPKEFARAVRGHTTLAALAAGHRVSVQAVRATMLRALQDALARAVKQHRMSATAAHKTLTQAVHALSRLR